MTRLFFAVSVLTGLLSISSGASAATFTVSNANDAGAGSLRDAVVQANATPAADTIVFDAGFFNVPRTITLTSGHIEVSKPVVINGPATVPLAISGNGQSRIFYQFADLSSLSISYLRLTNGFATQGGAIFSRGELTVTNCVISGNVATGDDPIPDQGQRAAIGGGIYASGITITDSTVSNNQALGVVVTNPNPNLASGASAAYGGGIYSFAPVIVNTIFNNNIAKAANVPAVPVGVINPPGGPGAYGGAVYTHSGGLIYNSTFQGNSITAGHGPSTAIPGKALPGDGGQAQGGAIHSPSRLRILNSTFSGNSATAGNGGTGAHDPVNFNGKGGEAVGGAIYNIELQSVNLTVLNNSVTGGNGRIAGNGQGGGIYGGSISWRIINSTIIANIATAGVGAQAPGANQGGGVYSRPGEAGPPSYFHNNIVDGNIAFAGPDVFGTFVEPCNNLIGLDNIGAITHGVNGNQVGSPAAPLDPMLGPLQNNGGFTETRAPLAGSTAINAGNNSKAINIITSRSDEPQPRPLLFDQRNMMRINPVGGTIDIGAVEIGSTTVPISSAPDLQRASDTGFSFEDNVTMSTSPAFDVVDVLPGGTVELLRNGVAVASASVNPFNFTTVLTDPNPPLDGAVQYTTRQTISGVTSVPSGTALGVTFDHTPPTVTINQAATQADPTSSAPIVFTAVFNEITLALEREDLSFAGSTADMSRATIFIDYLGSNTWRIQVNAINSPGQVVVSIPAGVVGDRVNLLNEASTSTDNSVTFEPVVVSATFTGRVRRLSAVTITPSIVTFTDPFTGEKWVTRTNRLGYYRLLNVPVYQQVGRRFTISVTNKSFVYNQTPQVIAQTSLSNVNINIP